MFRGFLEREIRAKELVVGVKFFHSRNDDDDDGDDDSHVRRTKGNSESIPGG